MMETTQTGARYHRRVRTRFRFDQSAVGRVFVERVVNAVLLVVGDIIPDEAPQMFFMGMTRSSSSRRQLPTHRSAIPFSQGALFRRRTYWPAVLPGHRLVPVVWGLICRGKIQRGRDLDAFSLDP
jgi:hypothetical protein